MATDRIQRYADLIVRVGADVQPGQTVFVLALPEHAPLVRELARSAYEAGASYVDVLYSDPHVRRAMIERAADDILTYSPPWLIERYRSAADGGALIMIAGEDEPELLADLDQTRVGKARTIDALKEVRRGQGERTMAWTIAAWPTAGWANLMFGEPDTERLWNAVAATVGLEDADPVARGRLTSQSSASAHGS
jgi:Leucyl aminopeptidase (aminopeptidase T)